VTFDLEQHQRDQVVLREFRVKFQKAVRSGVRARTPEQKRRVLERWRKTFHPYDVETLILVMKDQRATEKILAWKVSE